MSWKVTEFEGYTNREVASYLFDTEQEALDFWNHRRSANRFSGVGGQWKHYYSYPEEVERDVA